MTEAHAQGASEPFGWVRVWDWPDCSPDFFEIKPAELEGTKLVPVYTSARSPAGSATVADIAQCVRDGMMDAEGKFSSRPYSECVADLILQKFDVRPK